MCNVHDMLCYITCWSIFVAFDNAKYASKSLCPLTESKCISIYIFLLHWGIFANFISKSRSQSCLEMDRDPGLLLGPFPVLIVSHYPVSIRWIYFIFR